MVTPHHRHRTQSTEIQKVISQPSSIKLQLACLLEIPRLITSKTKGNTDSLGKSYEPVPAWLNQLQGQRTCTVI